MATLVTYLCNLGIHHLLVEAMLSNMEFINLMDSLEIFIHLSLSIDKLSYMYFEVQLLPRGAIEVDYKELYPET